MSYNEGPRCASFHEEFGDPLLTKALQTRHCPFSQLQQARKCWPEQLGRMGRLKGVTELGKRRIMSYRGSALMTLSKHATCYQI